MKTISMHQDYTYRAKHNVHIKYLEGYTYQRVPEAAARAIVKAAAGRLIQQESIGLVDA